MIKVVAPNMACQVIDWAMQVHGGGGMCEDFPLAYFYASARTLRFADGPDEVHRNAIAKIELGKLRLSRAAAGPGARSAAQRGLRCRRGSARRSSRCSASRWRAVAQRAPATRSACAHRGLEQRRARLPARPASGSTQLQCAGRRGRAASSARRAGRSRSSAAQRALELAGRAALRSTPGRVAGALATAPKWLRSTRKPFRLTFGNITSQRISSGVPVSICVCMPSVKLLEGLPLQLLHQRLGQQQHLQVGRQAQLHAQAQLVAVDVGALRRAPLQAPGLAVEPPSMTKPSPSRTRLKLQRRAASPRRPRRRQSGAGAGRGEEALEDSSMAAVNPLECRHTARAALTWRTTTMIEVYSWATPNGHKVHIMLEECGLPYRVIPVDIGAGDQFKPEFLAISPNNKIPAIVDPDGPGRRADLAVRVGRDPALPGRQDRPLPARRHARQVRGAAVADVPDGRRRPDARPGAPLPHLRAGEDRLRRSTATPTRRSACTA